MLDWRVKMSNTNRAFGILPYYIQNIGISLVNSNSYRVRHSGKYKECLDYYKKWDKASQKALREEELRRLNLSLQHAKDNSIWYNDKISEKAIKSGDLSSIPILEKNEIINNLDQIKTLNEKDGLVSLTGGTTGASMKVVYTKEDMQERFAILDSFREKHGYKIGKRTAWFSGKNLISENDIKKGVCSHYDFINKIRFYSTFHINKQNFDVYWKSLNKFQPEFIVGFPSSVYEICRIADSKGLRLDTKVKVFFPTAETVLPQHREVIGRVLSCKLVDQYASSEGAPFILECPEGNLHIHSLTGIFEVVDENMQPALEGEILVTSFITKGTPIIRYRIGDRISLFDYKKECECGSHFPLVKVIEGRSNDFIYSHDKGKVNLGNLSNSTKGINGIVCFQIIQEKQECITLKIVTSSQYSQKEENKFLSAIRERVGSSLEIELEYVDEIPREKSGKFQIVKNNLKLDNL